VNPAPRCVFSCPNQLVRLTVPEYFYSFRSNESHSIDIITAGFQKRELFSGNVDREVITETARKYGFSFDTDYSKTKHGEHLYDIMQHRNDLAHGNKSFAEIGQQTSIEDLLKVKEEVIEYLQQILQNIQEYLENEEYLDTST